MNATINHSEKTVPGLDIDSNLIGWCLIGLKSNEPVKVVDIGVRILNKGVKDKIPTPKNVKLREARLSRGVIRRRSRRGKRLESYLWSHENWHF